MTSPNTIHLVANSGSGQGRAREVVALVRQRCREQGIELCEYIAQRPRGLPRQIARAHRQALLDGGRVLAVGGDGTLRSVAQKLAGTQIPMAVVPTGTFNFFARNLNIPEPLEPAIELAISGQASPVDLGCVNQRVFLINASFGLYARLIRAREQHTRLFGRHRLVAIASTLLTLLRGYRAMALTLNDHRQQRGIKSPMVFVGINSLQLRGIDLDVADCIHERKLAVVVMKPVTQWALFRLSLRGLLRRLRDEESLERFCAEDLRIRLDRRSTSVVLDGERMRLRGPLKFSILPNALQVIQPDEVA